MIKKFKPIKFPEDELAHDKIIEWWYFNGHLEDKRGNQYAFMNCLFKANNKKVNIPFLSKIPVDTIYFYHSIISDISRGKTIQPISDISVVSNDSFSKKLLYIDHTNPLMMKGFVNRVIEKTGTDEYFLKDENIELKMISTKTPLLEGGDGYIKVSNKESYYYSLTNLKTEGKIKIGNEWVEVSGKSWMDHQWADTAYTKDKWNWFSLQLDNNIEMVCYEYLDDKTKTCLASISYKDGTNENHSNVEIVSFGRKWKSLKTKAQYPMNWHIKVPGKNIDLKIEAPLRKQEVIFGSINY